MQPATKPALLTDTERQSALWAKIKAHLEQRLDAKRVQNDGNKDAIETARLRGRIAEIKNLLALDKPAPVVEEEHTE